MYIWFEGVGGTRGCWRAGRGWGCDLAGGSGLSVVLDAGADGRVGSGGGKGETERAVTEAEGWAL